MENFSDSWDLLMSVKFRLGQYIIYRMVNLDHSVGNTIFGFAFANFAPLRE